MEQYLEGYNQKGGFRVKDNNKIYKIGRIMVEMGKVLMLLPILLILIAIIMIIIG